MAAGRFFNDASTRPGRGAPRMRRRPRGEGKGLPASTRPGRGAPRMADSLEDLRRRFGLQRGRGAGRPGCSRGSSPATPDRQHPASTRPGRGAPRMPARVSSTAAPTALPLQRGRGAGRPGCANPPVKDRVLAVLQRGRGAGRPGWFVLKAAFSSMVRLQRGRGAGRPGCCDPLRDLPLGLGASTRPGRGAPRMVTWLVRPLGGGAPGFNEAGARGAPDGPARSSKSEALVMLQRGRGAGRPGWVAPSTFPAGTDGLQRGRGAGRPG